MIASLPMYWRAETKAATQRFWQYTKEALADNGIPAPQFLSHDLDLFEMWLNPGLVLAQTCGFPYRARLHGRVSLVARPVHNLDCAAGCYYSVIVMRKGDGLDGRDSNHRAAVNDALSQSGWAALTEWARERNLHFGSVHASGSHRRSAQMVAEGHSDIAAIDAVTWEMITRWDGFAGLLDVVDTTPETPSLPYITALGQNAGAIGVGLSDAIGALSEDDRLTLCLGQIAKADPQQYLAVPIPDAPDFS